MNRRTTTLSLSLPQGLDDDTVLELWGFLNDLSEAFDSTYGHQIRRALEARRPKTNPHQPWLPFDDQHDDPAF